MGAMRWERTHGRGRGWGLGTPETGNHGGWQ